MYVYVNLNVYVSVYVYLQKSLPGTSQGGYHIYIYILYYIIYIYIILYIYMHIYIYNEIYIYIIRHIYIIIYTHMYTYTCTRTYVPKTETCLLTRSNQRLGHFRTFWLWSHKANVCSQDAQETHQTWQCRTNHFVLFLDTS